MTPAEESQSDAGSWQPYLRGSAGSASPTVRPRLLPEPGSGTLGGMAARLPKKEGDSLGPPWTVVFVEALVALAVMNVAHWLVPLPGNWDLIVWIGVGAPLAAWIHRFNKARYGAATRPPLWASRRR